MVVPLVVTGVTVAVLATGGDRGFRGIPEGGPSPGTGAFLGPGAPEVGQPAPDFQLPRLDGRGTIRLSELRGRPVVVNFWASWCNPCRQEFPLLRAARAKHRRAGLEVIGISYRDIPSDARAFARSENATWPLARDPGGAVAAGYGVRAIPQTFFVGRDGIVAARVFGLTSARDLDDTLAEILPRRAR